MKSMDGINGWSIETLLRGENDSEKSDEIQAKPGISLVREFKRVGKSFISVCKKTQEANRCNLWLWKRSGFVSYSYAYSN